ncbi:MAG: rhodanese-like domain-containing protein [Oligoflexia bacterium]|nr:rhodanese-like domain-containing protein [Oligoflexia bacterium]
MREITPLELKQRQQAGERITMIDVREAFEKEIADIGGVLIPKAEILNRQSEIPRDGIVVIYCRSGGRSSSAIKALQQQCGFTNLVNLSGGILRWSDEVDSSIEKY